MLLSHRKRFIYTKTVKTGGTSVEAYFEPWCMPEGVWSPSHPREMTVTDAGIVGYRGAQKTEGIDWYNHMPAQRIRQQVGEDIWNGYYKFCVVRSPFERAVSAFYFFQRRSDAPLLRPETTEVRLQFERFVEAGGLPNDRGAYMIDGQICVDGVIRHERMIDDMARICARLDVPWDPSCMPRYKAGVRPIEATVTSLFTERARRFIESQWSFELSTFGYRFPE
jgi:hypothetical protein